MLGTSYTRYWLFCEDLSSQNIYREYALCKSLQDDRAYRYKAPQEEIKHTLEHNNQSYGYWCALSYKLNNNNKVKLTLTYDMGWQNRYSGRRYDSSIKHAFIIGKVARVSYEWSSIPRPVGSLTLHKREEKKQKNMSVQRTFREAQKLWRFLLY